MCLSQQTRGTRRKRVPRINSVTKANFAATSLTTAHRHIVWVLHSLARSLLCELSQHDDTQVVRECALRLSPRNVVQVASAFSHMLSLHNLTENVVTSQATRSFAHEKARFPPADGSNQCKKLSKLPPSETNVWRALSGVYPPIATIRLLPLAPSSARGEDVPLIHRYR